MRKLNWINTCEKELWNSLKTFSHQNTLWEFCLCCNGSL